MWNCEFKEFVTRYCDIMAVLIPKFQFQTRKELGLEYGTGIMTMLACCVEMFPHWHCLTISPLSYMLFCLALEELESWRRIRNCLHTEPWIWWSYHKLCRISDFIQALCKSWKAVLCIDYSMFSAYYRIVQCCFLLASYLQYLWDSAAFKRIFISSTWTFSCNSSKLKKYLMKGLAYLRWKSCDMGHHHMSFKGKYIVVFPTDGRPVGCRFSVSNIVIYIVNIGVCLSKTSIIHHEEYHILR